MTAVTRSPAPHSRRVPSTQPSSRRGISPSGGPRVAPLVAPPSSANPIRQAALEYHGPRDTRPKRSVWEDGRRHDRHRTRGPPRRNATAANPRNGRLRIEGVEREGTFRRAIAVIGSGVAGLTAGYVLSGRQRVTLFEADTRLG